MSEDLYFTINFLFLSFFFFFRRLISELTERKSTKIGHMVGSKCNLKRISNIWDIPSSYKSVTQNHLLWTTAQLNANFNGLYLRKETRQSVKCVDNYKMSSTSSQNVVNFGPQTASNSTCILPTLRKFCIMFRCHASQPEISKRNSTKLCQTVGGR